MRLTRMALPLAVIIGALLVGWTASRVTPDPRNALLVASQYLPPSTTSASFTDWSAIRAALDGYALDPAEGGEPGSADDPDAEGESESESFMLAASATDLSYQSLLESTTPEMQEWLGFSPLTIEWEMYARSGAAAAGKIIVVMGLGTANSAADVADTLQRIGYQRTDGVWQIGINDFAKQTLELPTVLRNIAIRADEGIVVASESPQAIRDTLARVDDDARSLADVRSVRSIFETLRGAISATVMNTDEACAMSSMTNISGEEEARADAVLAPLGTLEAIERLGLGLYVGADARDEARLRYAMTFDSGEQARDQRRIRGQLATGAIIGRLSSIEDFMRLDDARTAGPTAVLDFVVEDLEDSPLTQIGTGPMLFAACALN